MRRRAELALHEGLIDIEGTGPEHIDRAENGFEEGDAFLDIGHGYSDVMHAVDSFCHGGPLASWWIELG